LIIQNKCGTTALFDISSTSVRVDIFKWLTDYDAVGIRGWRGTNCMIEGKTWLTEYSHPPGALNEDIDIANPLEGKKIPPASLKGETGKLTISTCFYVRQRSQTLRWMLKMQQMGWSCQRCLKSKGLFTKTLFHWRVQSLYLEQPTLGDLL